MTAKSSTPGEPTLGVTESSKGRTTTITLPDGTTAKRTSKTMAYTHAVVMTTDQRAEARSLRAEADDRAKYVEALQAWVDAGADRSKLKAYPSGSLSMADRARGKSPNEYYLPGFEPVKKVAPKHKGAGGGVYWSDQRGYSLPNFNDTETYDYAYDETGINGKTAWEAYGPEFSLKNQRARIAQLRTEADKLDAGPAETYGVVRWSQSFQNAMSGSSQFEQIRNARLQIIGVGGVAKAPTKPAKVVPTAEEPAAAPAPAAPVWVDRATGEPVANPTQVDIVRGFVVQEQDRVPAATMGQTPAATAKALNQASSVVEGQAILARRDRGQLAAIAIELGMPQAMVGRYTKEDLKAAIIQKAIQARLNSAAIRDQANYNIYSSGQRPASAGPYRDVKDGRDMTAPDVTLPPFGAEVIDSITNATSNSQARSYLNTESLAYLKKLAAHPDVAVAFASSVKKDDLIDAIVRRLYGRAATADAVERAVNRPKA